MTVTVTDDTDAAGSDTVEVSVSAVENVSFIVRLVKGLSSGAQQQVIARNGGVETSSVPVLRMHFIDVPSASVDAVMQKYQSDPQVLSIERDKVRQAEGTPSDPSYTDQWALPKIGWDSVFGAVTPSGSSIVAVLDTGINASHPDLSGIVLPGYSVFEDSDPNTDPNGHGTEMAGIAAALTDNGAGVAGVAYAGVSLLPVQVLGTDGTGLDSDIINGIVWATDNGANVILMAFSNPGFSPALQDAIDYAWDSGVILVAATGNDGSSTVTYPAGDRGVMGISATDQNDALASSSNYGQEVFLAAPGVDVATTANGGSYTNITGTSASAAIVAGAAAFMHAVDSSLTNGTIVGRLARTADPAGTQEQTGNGRLNMARALGDTTTAPVQPVGAPPLGNGGPFVGPYVAAKFQPSAVTVGSQTGSLTYGTGASATYSVSVTAGGNGTLTVGVTGLPSGASFSPTTSTSKNFTLIITTSSSTPAGTSTFTLTVTDQGSASNNSSLTVGKKTASVTATDASKTYGASDPAFATTNSGFMAGDLGVGKITFSASRAGGESASPPTYTITPAAIDSGTSLLNNYTVTLNNGTFTINKKAASVTANSKNKIYGADNPALTAVVTGTIEGGDAINYTLSTTAVKLSGIGSYPITVTLGSNPNYDVTPTGSTLSIGKAALTITAENKSKQYSDPMPTFTVLLPLAT